MLHKNTLYLQAFAGLVLSCWLTSLSSVSASPILLSPTAFPAKRDVGKRYQCQSKTAFYIDDAGTVQECSPGTVCRETSNESPCQWLDAGGDTAPTATNGETGAIPGEASATSIPPPENTATSTVAPSGNDPFPLPNGQATPVLEAPSGTASPPLGGTPPAPGLDDSANKESPKEADDGDHCRVDEGEEINSPDGQAPKDNPANTTQNGEASPQDSPPEEPLDDDDHEECEDEEEQDDVPVHTPSGEEALETPGGEFSEIPVDKPSQTTPQDNAGSTQQEQSPESGNDPALTPPADTAEESEDELECEDEVETEQSLSPFPLTGPTGTGDDTVGQPDMLGASSTLPGAPPVSAISIEASETSTGVDSLPTPPALSVTPVDLITASEPHTILSATSDTPVIPIPTSQVEAPAAQPTASGIAETPLGKLTPEPCLDEPLPLGENKEGDGTPAEEPANGDYPPTR
ncbi:hypothetical protein NliqN6_3834 [Naganishia liquefaciens]|uniref:Uncharacterized protein n=1 Tax=Naganishia liquefaciens TaxID=104408 RepID=A0A8H3YGP8_9TREE|nr:hypothetical protein NliqN6_3834 [Naganishia liquefaciens]